MSLLSLWRQDRAQIEGKRLDQLIAFAGDGRLLDGGATATELREMLSAAPSELLKRWKDEALSVRYDGFGFVLQDLVNEVGKRLGFEVDSGRYRGRVGEEGHDGLWRTKEGHLLLVDTKTSSSHRIELRRLSEARRKFVENSGVAEERVSILIVIAEENTEELEAQVRGSRSAWEVRLLGVEALYKLLSIKEALDDEAVEQQVQRILVPQEFTRLDKIVDLVFATAEDVQEAEVLPVGGEQEALIEENAVPSSRSAAARFHLLILPSLERRLGTPLVKRSRVLWSSPENEVLVSCQVSKEYEGAGGVPLYWFGLKRTTEEPLANHKNAFCAFGLGSPEKVVLLPFPLLKSHLGGFFTSPEPDGQILHWHVRFRVAQGRTELLINRDSEAIDVSTYVLDSAARGSR
jgi:hypothetical protein